MPDGIASLVLMVAPLAFMFASLAFMDASFELMFASLALMVAHFGASLSLRESEIGGGDPKPAPEPTPPRVANLELDVSWLAKGVRAKLVGLEKAPHLNGELVSVLDPVPEPNGKIRVRIIATKMNIIVSPQNLEAAADVGKGDTDDGAPKSTRVPPANMDKINETLEKINANIEKLNVNIEKALAQPQCLFFFFSFFFFF